ncbi:MAG: DUF4834 family protein [Hymenobacter sp.]|nr:DUF4834 family protein [Hymenobacter sp.]
MAKFLLVLFVLSLVLRFVVPVVLRWLVVGFVKKQTRRYNQPFGASPFEAPAGPPRDGATAPGQVQVDFVPPKPQPKSAKHFEGGEYVDFEEVK